MGCLKRTSLLALLLFGALALAGFTGLDRRMADGPPAAAIGPAAAAPVPARPPAPVDPGEVAIARNRVAWAALAQGDGWIERQVEEEFPEYRLRRLRDDPEGRGAYLAARREMRDRLRPIVERAVGHHFGLNRGDVARIRSAARRRSWPAPDGPQLFDPAWIGDVPRPR